MTCEGHPEGEIPNGSFEEASDSGDVPRRWSRVLYPGGSGAYDVADRVHGARSYRFDHPGGKGRGGGYLESDHIPASPLFFPPIRFACKASVPGIKVACAARHFGRDREFLGEQEIYAAVDQPAAWGLVVIANVPWAWPGTQSIRIRLVGGKDDTDVAGSVWFDAVGVEGAPAAVPVPEVVDQPAVATRSAEYADVGDAWEVTVPPEACVSWLYVGIELMGHAWSNEMGEGFSRPRARFRIGDRHSSEVIGPATDAWAGPYHASANVEGLRGKQPLRFQLRAEPDAAAKVFLRSRTAAAKYFRPNVRRVDAGKGTVEDGGE